MAHARRTHLLLLVALVAAAAVWAQSAPAPTRSPGRLTIHGVALGMPWAEVVALHPERKSGDGRTQSALLETAEGSPLAVDLEGDRVKRVSGDRLESDGVEVLRVGSTMADLRATLGSPARDRFEWKSLNNLEYPRSELRVLAGRKGWLWSSESDWLLQFTLGEL